MDDNSTVNGEPDSKLFDYDGMSDCNYSDTASSTSEASKVDRIREIDRKVASISKETQASRVKKSKLKQKFRNAIESRQQMEDIYEQMGVKIEANLTLLENEISKTLPIFSNGLSMLKSLQEYVELKSIKLELLSFDTEEMETESSPNNLLINYPTEEQTMAELMERAAFENANFNCTEHFNLKQKESEYKKLMEAGVKHYNEILKKCSVAEEKCDTECITIPDTQPFDVNF